MKIWTEKGAAAVEFAVILPLLILLIAGIVEFSLLYFNKQILVTATREGARLGIVVDPVATTDAEIRERVRKVCRQEYNEGDFLGLGNFLPMLKTFGAEIVNIPDADITITRTPSTSPGGPDDPDDLTVGVEYKYRFVLPAILRLGNTITLRPSTVMKMESDT